MQVSVGVGLCPLALVTVALCITEMRRQKGWRLQSVPRRDNERSGERTPSEILG